MNEFFHQGHRTLMKNKIHIWRFTIRMSLIIKRSLDLIVSFTMLIILLPLMLLIALLIFAEDGGDVLFKQKRVGLNGHLFTMYKFRSMKKNQHDYQLINEIPGKRKISFKMRQDPRITKTGKYLRHYSLDELPQLINILWGNMSLVGPRPPLPAEVENYTPYELRRLNVKPGLTCYWQIQGRSNLPFDEQVRLDLKYIQSKTIWGDLRILLKTIPAVITGRGAY